MQSIQPHEILQRWNVVQYELLPELKQEYGGFSPKLEKLIHILEWVRIEEFISGSPCGTVGRPQSERAWLANAFVAKAVLNMNTTNGLIERRQLAVNCPARAPVTPKIVDHCRFAASENCSRHRRQ